MIKSLFKSLTGDPNVLDDSHNYNNELLNDEIEIKKKNRSQKTNSTYNSGKRLFNTWCISNQVDITEFSLNELELFVKYASTLKKKNNQNYSHSWIEINYKSATEIYRENYARKHLEYDGEIDKIPTKTTTISMIINNYNISKHIVESKLSKSFTDSYSIDEHYLICRYFWNLKDSHVGLKYLVDHLIGHAALNRGFERRAMELSDFNTKVILFDGINERALVIMIHKSKMNQTYGQVEHSFMLRHLDPRICPIGMIAIYLFQRFTVYGEGFPDLSTKSSYYDIKLIYGESFNVSLSDTAHSKVIKTMIGKLNLNISKITHIGYSFQKSGSNKWQIFVLPFKNLCMTLKVVTTR
eukprot:NODE_133_length_16612_cov_1.402531.p1 type:complete len:354 gc:universal NODE_133_length_16612_cov_1.402531:10911-9850(-)